MTPPIPITPPTDTSPPSLKEPPKSKSPLENFAELTGGAAASFAISTGIAATYYTLAKGMTLRTAIPLGARSVVMLFAAAGPEMAAGVLGGIVGGATASNKLGRALGLEHSLGHYVGLEWIGNQLGDLAVSAFGPADPNGAFVAKADALLDFLGLH